MFNKFRWIIIATIMAMSFFLMSCTKVKDASHGVGKATGKTVDTIKEVPHEVREGYREGRSPDNKKE